VVLFLYNLYEILERIIFAVSLEVLKQSAYDFTRVPRSLAIFWWVEFNLPLPISLQYTRTTADPFAPKATSSTRVITAWSRWLRRVKISPSSLRSVRKLSEFPEPVQGAARRLISSQHVLDTHVGQNAGCIENASFSAFYLVKGYSRPLSPILEDTDLSEMIKAMAEQKSPSDKSAYLLERPYNGTPTGSQ